jgi:hypothetical protein
MSSPQVFLPTLLPLQELDLSPEYPIGDKRSRRRISEDPNQVMGVRDNHPEDDFRIGALAGITPVVVAAFEQLILREVPRVPFGAILLIVTAVMNAELAEIIMRLK